MIIALSNGVEIAWWVALGLGLVVALVVWALLEILRRSVHTVRRDVDDVLAMGGRVAQNTWNVQLLEVTKARGAELLEELRHHGAERSGQ
jgi:hypothetical protein